MWEDFQSEGENSNKGELEPKQEKRKSQKL
jgi:hypothetical protein